MKVVFGNKKKLIVCLTAFSLLISLAVNLILVWNKYVDFSIVSSEYSLADLGTYDLEIQDEGQNIVTGDDAQVFVHVENRYVKDIFLYLNFPVGTDWVLQVFYSNEGEDYTENHSISEIISGQSRMAVITLEETVDNLRIDLGNESGTTFSIDKVQVNATKEEMLNEFISNIPLNHICLMTAILMIIGFCTFNFRTYLGRINADAYRKGAFFWILMVLGGGIFAFVWLIITGNRDQVYTDVVYESVSACQSNKSAERTLLYALIFVGISFLLLCLTLNIRKSYILIDRENSRWKDDFPGKTLVCAFVVMSGVWYLFYMGTSPLLIITGIYISMLLVMNRKVIKEGLILYFSMIYVGVALYRIYVIAGGLLNANIVLIALVSVAFCMFAISGKSIPSNLVNGVLMAQCIVPFMLFVYLQDVYKVGNEYRQVGAPMPAKAVIIIIISLFELEAITKIRKHWNCNSMNGAMTFGMPVSVMAMNAFSGSGAIVPADLHHSFENIIGFSQIFEKGLMPYKEYISASGFYSIVQGAFFKVFGDGLFCNYYLTENIFYLFVGAMIIAALCLHLEKSYVFFIAIVFNLMGYNRVAFTLPFMLILMWPKLIEKRNLWLKIWFLTSFFQGLYYPIYGAAVCIAFLPLGVWQVYQYIRTGDLKVDMKKVSFWLWWLICLSPAMIGLNILWGTFKHIKAMGGQTIYADGIARFAQAIPDSFLPYLSNHLGLRIALFYILTFLIPAFAVWVAFAVTVRLAEMHIADGDKIKVGNWKAGLVSIALAIMPCIAYSFTIVRLDPGNIYNRNYQVLFILSVLFIVIAVTLEQNARIRRVIIYFAIFVPSVTGAFSFHNIDGKLQAYYMVPDGFVYTEDDVVSKWGTAFVNPEIYESVRDAYMLFLDDRDRFHFGTMPNFGYYYLCDIKPVSVIEIGLTVKGFEAAQESVDLLKQYPAIVGGHGDTFSGNYAFSNYYLYYWLLTSGNYVWSEEKDVFIPNTEGLSLDEVAEINKDAELMWEDADFGLHTSSLGASLNTLEEVFKASNIEYTLEKKDTACHLQFETPIDGKNADHLYIEFKNMDKEFDYIYAYGEDAQEITSPLQRLLLKKRYNSGAKVIVQWEDDIGVKHRIKCSMSKGKLLIPLGSGLKWLLNAHQFIDIWVEYDGVPIDLPPISDVKLLKLREIQ